MKKMLIFLMCLSVLGFAACNRNDQENNGKKTIGLVVSTMNNPFFVEMVNGAKKEAKELGYNLIVLDSQDDSAKELSNVEDLSVRNISVLLINPTDSDAVIASVESANRYNIPVVTLDRNSNGGKVVSAVASDNEKGGYMAGEYIKKELGNKAVIAELEGIAGTSAARSRGKGFAEAVKGMNIVAKQPADFDRAKGMVVMENMLQSHPEINAVFAQNDEMALGAIQAIKHSGKKVMIVGFDATKDGLEAVNNGSLAATIAQQPILIGETGIQVADKIIKSESTKSNYPVNLKLITGK
jgi:ribose transport system substrate-binding protein